jgi:hypothetical protein
MFDHGSAGILLLAVVIAARFLLQRGITSRRRRG